MAGHREVPALVFPCGTGIFPDFYEPDEGDAWVGDFQNGGNGNNGNDNDTENTCGAYGA